MVIFGKVESTGATATEGAVRKSHLSVRSDTDACRMGASSAQLRIQKKKKKESFWTHNTLHCKDAEKGE